MHGFPIAVARQARVRRVPVQGAETIAGSCRDILWRRPGSVAGSPSTGCVRCRLSECERHPAPAPHLTGSTLRDAPRVLRRRAPVLSRQCLQFDPPTRTVLIRSVISYPPTLSPERGCGAPPGPNGTACQQHVGCHQVLLPLSGNHGSFPAGTHVGVMRRTYTLLRGDFFAFRFVSDFRARQHIDSIDQFFPD